MSHKSQTMRQLGPARSGSPALKLGQDVVSRLATDEFIHSVESLVRNGLTQTSFQITADTTNFLEPVPSFRMVCNVEALQV